MHLENADYVLFTDDEERAETALESYLEERSETNNDASTDYRYFILGDDTITIIEDIRIGEKILYNRIEYTEEDIEIEKFGK